LKKGTQKKVAAKQDQQPLNDVKGSKYFDIIGLAIIVILGVIIYSDSFGCSFHFDDFHNIVENNAIRNLADVKAWWTFYPSRPLGILTFALNYHFNQLDVWHYHLVNLAIHLVNACLVWWLVLLIFSSPALKDNPLIKHKHSIALLTALLFVSHPLATQSVTYIVQRLSSMVTLFYLLSLALYVHARLSGQGSRMKILYFTGSLLSAVVAMLTKENAFTLPFTILLFELFFLQTKIPYINFRDFRIILLLAIFLGILMIVPFSFSFSIFRPIPPTLGNTYTLTPVNYLLTQFSVIVKYIQLLFLPLKQNVEYDFPVSYSLFELRTLLSFLFLACLLVLAFFLYKRNRIISFGISWFFLTLSVESSIIPINDIIFEHRTYLPSFGFFLILTSVLFFLFRNRYRFIAISILLVIIGVNSFLTYERNKVWKDELSLLNDIISKPPVKARPYYNRGVIYGELGRWDDAIADYTKAIIANPEYLYAYNNRGNAYGKLGQWDKTVTDCSEMIAMDPKYATAWYNRGFAYANLSQWDKAIADYSQAIRLNRDYKDAYNDRGYSYASLGQWDKAITDYSKAIEIDPKCIQAYANRGNVYGQLGQWDKTLADCSSMIGIDPKYAPAWYNEGLAWANLGKWDKAIADYSRAIELDPNFTNAWSARDFAYGKLRNEKKR
jgi:protein O-mannosyl-transferase